MRNFPKLEPVLAVKNLLVGDSGSVCGRMESLLYIGASQVGQWAPLLKPTAQRRLHVTVDVPAEEKMSNKLCSQKAFGKL